VTEGNPTVVIGAAARGRAGEGQMCFCTEVALRDWACHFVVSADLTDPTEGDLVTDPIIVRQEKTEDKLSIFIW